MNEVVSTQNACMEKKPLAPWKKVPPVAWVVLFMIAFFGIDSLRLFHRREFPEHHAPGFGTAHPRSGCHPGYPDGGH